jgi:hypothetical protein
MTQRRDSGLGTRDSRPEHELFESRIPNPGSRGVSSGTTLVEVLVAMLVLITGVLSMARLFVLAAATNASSLQTTRATIAAAQKADELRADAVLNPSPTDTLARNVYGWVDHVDANGHSVGNDAHPPVGAAYTRRWSITSLSPDPDTVVIRVLVMRSERSLEASARWGEARLVTTKTLSRP